METVRDMMEMAETLSVLVADAILKRVSPVSDDISERQARLAYGSRWLRERKAEGLIEASRIGGKTVYSRHRLDCLRAAERRMAEIVSRDIKK